VLTTRGLQNYPCLNNADEAGKTDAPVVSLTTYVDENDKLRADVTSKEL